MKEKICLFLGSHRPVVGKRDSGDDLIRTLSQHVNLTTVYIPPDDPLKKRHYKHCEFRFIPKLMRQTRKCILESFNKKEFFDDWQDWLSTFVAEKYSLGVVYFGSWLPPELFNVPPLGFVNFHPGPLPALRGFEAETWAILTDMCYFYGTIHRVSLEYDEGEIIWRTPQVRIRKHETPDSLLQRTCYAGISHVHKLVRKLHAGKIETYPQKITDGILTTSKFVSSRAKINWAEDSLSIFDRKNRAFNGQYISVPLTLVHEGEERIIRDILLLPGEQQGGLGQYLGKYKREGGFEGRDMFQALDGIVVADLLPPSTKKPSRASVFAEYNDDILP